MLKKYAVRAALVGLAAVSAGCATIVAKSSQTITITSVPPAAGVSIKNAAGVAVHSGTTPMTVTLKKGRGYFKAESYSVMITKEGFQPREINVRGEVNGWYIGNLLFGGLIGFLAVDPATGAMYTLKPDKVDAALETLKVTRNGGERTLTVVLTGHLGAEVAKQLVEIDAG
jgi:hypothetical protein